MRLQVQKVPEKPQPKKKKIEYILNKLLYE